MPKGKKDKQSTDRANPDQRKPGLVRPPRPKEDFEEGTPMFGIGKRKIKRQQAKG